MQEKHLSTIEAEKIVKHCWQDEYELMKSEIEPVNDQVKKVFEQLKEQSIKIGVCTSDDRDIAESGLKKLGLYSMVDGLICGDDLTSVPKPYATNIYNLCEHIGVSTTDTIMVGDQPADMEMGIAARTAYNVGVLSGCGNR